jgi:uncharacterized protein (DUF2344 family)
MEDINMLLFEKRLQDMTEEQLSEHIRNLRTSRAEITLGRTQAEQKKTKAGEALVKSSKLDLTKFSPEQLAKLLEATKGLL